MSKRPICLCSCVRMFHSYLHVFVHQFIRTHVPTCVCMQRPCTRMRKPVCAWWHLETTIFIILTHFLLFPYPMAILMFSFHIFFLQVLPPFLGRGCTSRISSWYRALTYDTKAFVCSVGFEPILRLLPESHYSAILIQSLAERWWDTIHTFHIPEMKMTVTPHDFHRITSLRCDGLLINLEGESGILLGIDLLGEGT